MFNGGPDVHRRDKCSSGRQMFIDGTNVTRRVNVHKCDKCSSARQMFIGETNAHRRDKCSPVREMFIAPVCLLPLRCVDPQQTHKRPTDSQQVPLQTHNRPIFGPQAIKVRGVRERRRKKNLLNAVTAGQITYSYVPQRKI